MLLKSSSQRVVEPNPEVAVTNAVKYFQSDIYGSSLERDVIGRFHPLQVESITRDVMGRFHSVRPLEVLSINPSLAQIRSTQLAENKLEDLYSSEESDWRSSRFQNRENGNQRPSSDLQQWARNIQFWQLVVDSLSNQNETDFFQYIRNLSKENLQRITEDVGYGSQRLLYNKIRTLQIRAERIEALSQDEDQNTAAQKFMTFKAECGGVTDFHDGLSKRIGGIIL